MVGIMAASWAERAEILLNSIKDSGGGAVSKIEHLRQLKEVILVRDPSLLPEFVPQIVELQEERASPLRRLIAELIGEIGMKNVELLPDMVPTLISFLKDKTPAVARQAITTGTNLFRNVLEKVVIQGLYSSGIDDPLKLSWTWMLEFKIAVFPLAFQPGIDGIRLLAVKFIEALVLLYTPDPDLPSDPPNDAGSGFNISWLKGGHPLLNVGDLAMEASQCLRLLLDQLKSTLVKSLSNSMIIVLINSLSAIAKKRPSFYGRILPVLLCLDPASSVIKGVQVPGGHHALKNAFVACLKCTHSSAAPWRARLVEALKTMNSGVEGEKAINLDNLSGSMAINAEESKEDKVSLQVCDDSHNDLSRKRKNVQDNSDVAQDEIVSGKRLMVSPPLCEETSKDPLPNSHNSVYNEVPLVDSKPSTTEDEDSGPVQQLVGLFGAFVSQGDKATKSLELLISSISSDLLAEVVMANIRYLPPSCPKDGEEEPVPTMSFAPTSVNKNLPLMQPSTVVSDTFSLSSAYPLISSLLNVHLVTSHDNKEVSQKDEEKIGAEPDVIVEPSTVDDAITTPPAVPASIDQSVPEKINSSAQPYGNEPETIMSTIPGLDSARSSDGVEDSLDASHTFTGELQGTSQEHDLSLGSTVPLDTSSSNCMMTCTSETLSPSLAVSDASHVPSNTLVIPTQYVLPKMIVPDFILTDDQKDNLQKSAFLRILEAYKQVSLCGGSHIHLPLLGHLGIEFPLDLDPWELLQRHVLSDYANNEGHELTLRVLFRLYRESEQDQDFLSSRTAASVYEAFLLNVAQTLRETFPASDKSLGRLLGEVPYLSDGAVKLLESLCSPESREKRHKDFQSGDRVTQGLSAVWNLILLRPANRERCLQIALKSAVHHMEEVRMKAIRLVANKLFPMSSISQKIEDFAIENLQSLIDDSLGADGSTAGLQRDGDLERTTSAGQPPVNHPDNSEITTDGHSAQTKSSSSIPEAQRCMSLYFALCTKKHSLLRHIFTIYESISMGAKQAVHRHIPILIRTVGSSSELLGVISDIPTGSKNLLIQVLQTLTDGATPSRDLISTLIRLYNSRLKDAEILIPILSSLSKEEVLGIFPQLVNLPLEKFQAAITRLLQGLPQTSSSITPAEVLIAIHAIDPEKDGVPLKKVMEACSACFEQQHVFTQQVLAKVLNQLVEQIPLPLLFMRTVIQAISVYPALVEFVMEILSRLVNKQIWRFPKLWVGFLKCAIQTTPQSFSVLLQLPATQLENALSKNPTLKPPLAEHANQPNIRSTLPRSTLLVLGLVNDPQPSVQAQTSQSQAADTIISAADVTTEVTQEFADVR